MIEHSMQLLGISTDTAFCHPIADVGQSSNRGKIHVTGTVPCVTTSSKLFSYKMGRLLS